LIYIKATKMTPIYRPFGIFSNEKRSRSMTEGELLYLAMVVGAVSAFILVLAYESTTEAKGRDQRQR
jgi:hypothetical protein